MDQYAVSTYFSSIFERVTSDPMVLAHWIFTAILGIWLIFSIVLLYHWLRYNLHAFFTPIAMVLYLIVSLALIGYAAQGIV